MASADYRILTPERVGLQYATAGIGSRSAAALVDTAIQTAIVGGVIALLVSCVANSPSSSSSSRSSSLDDSTAGWIVIAIVVIFIFLVTTGYFALFEILWNGQTPGKRLLGLRVIRENGYPLRAVDAVVRNLVRIVDGLPGGYAVGLLVMLLNTRSKRLGDFAAGTIVVREDPRTAALSLSDLAAAATTTAPPPALGGTGVASAEDASYHLPTLRPEHATLVRDFLLRRDSLAPLPRTQLAARLATTIAAAYGLESLLNSEPDETFLNRFR
jgi:uncharacterized RDD family membrane protein YckC